MARNQFQFIDGSYNDETRPLSVQDTVNWIPEVASQAGARSSIILRSPPGLAPFALLPTFPIRGMRNVEGKLMVVSGTRLYRVLQDGTYTDIGEIPGVGVVSMSHNQVTGGNQLIIVNGISGFVYNTFTGAFSRITDDGYPGALMVDYIDQYLVQIEPGRRFWFHSELADALSYNSLDRYEAEASPDLMTSIVVANHRVWIFGERTIQSFVNTGQATNTFAPDTGSVVDIGCLAKFSVVKMVDRLFFYGSDGSVYMTEGYLPKRISNYAIEEALSACNPATMVAYIWEDRGHKVYYLTCAEGFTFGYDATTDRWHRRQSYELNRWRVNALAMWNGEFYAGDYTNGFIYRLSWGLLTEGDAPLISERIGPVLSNNQNEISIDDVEFVFGSGVIESRAGNYPSIFGDVPNANVGDII